MMRHTAIDTAYDRNELQTMFAMAGIVHPVSKHHGFKRSARKPAGWLRPLLPIAKPLALWWQRRRSGTGSPASGLTVKVLDQSPQVQNPQSAASPLMSHRPAGRRAPTVSAQQTLFVVLDQMGARHRAASSGEPLARAFEQMLRRDHAREQILAKKGQR